jgi:hypothetical protein
MNTKRSQVKTIDHPKEHRFYLVHIVTPFDDLYVRAFWNGKEFLFFDKYLKYSNRNIVSWDEEGR